MNWRLYLSLRYLTSSHKEKFISVISLISILGVGVGVAALIIVISVMSGFDNDLKEKILGTYSHIEILSDDGVRPCAELSDKILKSEHVKAISFFLNAQALVRRGANVTGVVAKGIDPDKEVTVNQLGTYIKKGSLDLGGNNIVIGSELAAKLDAKIGDAITLISPVYAGENKFAALGLMKAGSEKDFKISGIFTSGMYEYDSNLVYVSIPNAQMLLNTKNLVSGASVRLDDVLNVEPARRKLQEALGISYIIRTWIDSNRNLLEALKLEKTVMFIILTLIVMVACFNIASALIMTVLEKTKDIGILKAIGANRSDIMIIFAMQGAFIGLIGTFSGTILGSFLCWCLGKYKFINLPKDVYYIDKLPVKMEIQDLMLIVVCSIIISLVATIYPSYRASRLDPVEALRYE